MKNKEIKTEEKRTPESLVQEAPSTDLSADNSENMDMAQLLAQEEQESKAESQEVKGNFLMAKVVSIVKDGVLVDIGIKGEALIPIQEFGAKVPFSVGDEIPVIRGQGGPRDGYVKVSWKAAKDLVAWEEIQHSFDRKTPIRVTIKNETRGGLLAECENGLAAFIPASQIDVRPSHDLKKWKGQAATVYIMEFDRRKNNLVLSRRQWLSEENLKKKSVTLTDLKEGDVRKGTVTGVTSFGAFVDIGGIEGLLHIGELEWAHTNKVSDVLKVGQAIEVKVLKFDPETEKLSLSRKALMVHPWENVEKEFPVGTKVKGKVTTLTDFGAFVEIAPQVEGLLHATEISWKTNSQKPKELLKTGEMVEVKVLSVNREKEKISLSMKRVGENPWDELKTKYPVGTVLKVTVSSLVPFGALVRLPEGMEGLIHVSDFFWAKRVQHPQDVLTVGQEVDVKVLEVDKENEKISFGLKQMKPSPYETYSKGKRVTGAITRITDSGAFMEIEPEIEGYIPASEISMEKIEKPSDVLTVGENVEAKVMAVDAKERKIQVSIKQLDRELQRAAVQKYSGKTPGPALGDLLDS